MNIKSISNSNYSKTTISHQAHMHKMAFYSPSPIKNIRGNRCACCGEEMIPYPVTANLWAKITLPISQVVKGLRLERLKEEHPNVYKVLNYFAYMYPNQSLDSILLDGSNHNMFVDSITHTVLEANDSEFPSSVAFRKAIKRETMNIFNIFESNLKNSSEVIKELKPLEKFMHNEKREIFEELEYLSAIYPDKKLSELVQLPEVVEKHIRGCYDDAIEFAKKRDFHWQKADEIILKENSNLQDALKKLHSEVNAIYNDDDPQRCAYFIKKLYKGFLEKNNLEHIEKPVLEEISQLPVRGNTKNLVMAKIRNNYSDGAIVRFLTRPAMESEKRIIHVDDGGSNNLTNKVVMCRDCSDDLNKLPFEEFCAYRPEIIENTKKQIKLVEDRIIDGSIDFSFRHYPIEVAKVLDEYTNGIVKPDLAEYIAKIKEMENCEGLP